MNVEALSPALQVIVFLLMAVVLYLLVKKINDPPEAGA